MIRCLDVGKMRLTMRRGWAFLFVAASGLAGFSAAPACAAQLTVDAPASCADPLTLAQEVADLIGRPLAEIPDIDFRIRIAETSPQKWRLRLETVEGQGSTARASAVSGTREIDGKSCSELAEAASVAIAVSVRSMEAAERTPPPPAAVTPALSGASPAPASVVVSSPPSPAWRPFVTVGLVTDTGALPSTSPGLELEGDLQRGRLRLVLLGTWFTSQEGVGTGGARGTFQLALGGGLACFAPRRGRWTLLACGGGELGRLAGTGLVTRPETGTLLWRAVRAEAGVTAGLGTNTAILLRAGVVRPLARPDFVLDQHDAVYRPSEVGVRLTAGLELGF
jgi:hypothetical protein